LFFFPGRHGIKASFLFCGLDFPKEFGPSPLPFPFGHDVGEDSNLCKGESYPLSLASPSPPFLLFPKRGDCRRGRFPPPVDEMNEEIVPPLCSLVHFSPFLSFSFLEGTEKVGFSPLSFLLLPGPGSQEEDRDWDG